jgi:hypothetical protein
MRIQLEVTGNGGNSFFERTLREQLAAVAKNFTNEQSRKIANKFAERIQKDLEQTLPRALEKAAQRVVNNIFVVKPDSRGALFRVMETDAFTPTRFLKDADKRAGQLRQFDSVLWKPLGERHLARKRAKARGDTFFVFRGNLKRVMERRLPPEFAKRIPEVGVSVVKSNDKVSVKITFSKSPLVGNLTGDNARQVQDRILARLGFSTVTRHKLAGPDDQSWRPTVLVAAKHFETFTVPRLVEKAVAASFERVRSSL